MRLAGWELAKRRLTLGWLLLFVLGGTPQAPAQSSIPRDTLRLLKQATVFVRVRHGNRRATGSGFVVGRVNQTGFIVTNAHVIVLEVEEDGKTRRRAASSISIVLNSGQADERPVPAELMGLDPQRDLALLRVTAPDLPEPLDFRSPATPFETQKVYVFGFPFGSSLAVSGEHPAVTVSPASVSSIRRDANDELAVIQVDGSVNPGNSGGPVVTRTGKLLGVAVAKIENSQVGFVIPTSHLLDMLYGRFLGLTALISPMRSMPRWRKKLSSSAASSAFTN